MSKQHAFNIFDIVVISCIVLLVWIIMTMLAYYAYQLFLFDEGGDRVPGVDDSTRSTSIFLDDNKSQADDMSTSNQIFKSAQRIRRMLSLYFYNNTYDLNILLDHENRRLIETTVMKADIGIGLDIKRGKRHGAEVTGFKTFPSWTTNPAQLCDPSIEVGDCIVAVNGITVTTFTDTVTAVKDSPRGEVILHLRRKKRAKSMSLSDL